VLFREVTEHRQACRPCDTPFPRKRKDLAAHSPGGLLFAAQAEGLGPCSPRTPGGVGLSESKTQPSGTSREHEPNGCGESTYETKRGNHLISIMHSCSVDKKVNRQTLETMRAYCGKSTGDAMQAGERAAGEKSGSCVVGAAAVSMRPAGSTTRKWACVHGVSAVCTMCNVPVPQPSACCFI
jgi:hypothetical protein